ncbi:MAG: cytochrome c maturation protein CcmE [Acidimicrobiaceae bacterium]|nr:cytochrome c maturation protein CcmE [Acidimicrobiaceae bacterium]
MDGAAALPESTGTRSTDVEGEELSPLVPRPAVRSARARRCTAALVIVAVAAGVALLVSNLLGDSALFFYNADEAVERRDDLASQRFRLQGTPLFEPADAFFEDRPVLAFTVGFNGAEVDVVHTGDPPELFQPGVPVVLEGAWQQGPGPGPAIASDGWHFASDRMLVKHDNDYRGRDGYDERITDAEEGASQP